MYIFSEHHMFTFCFAVSNWRAEYHRLRRCDIIALQHCVHCVDSLSQSMSEEYQFLLVPFYVR